MSETTPAFLAEALNRLELEGPLQNRTALAYLIALRIRGNL